MTQTHENARTAPECAPACERTRDDAPTANGPDGPSASRDHAPHPVVGVILLWYPLFTQSFIFRDVEGINAHLPTRVYTLYGRNERLCSKEMVERALPATRLGAAATGRVLLSNLREFARSPKRYVSLFRDAVCRPWHSFELLGEALWAFLAGVHLAPVLKADGVETVYAPWPRGSATAARTILRLAGIPYVVTARADNLMPLTPDLADKLADAAIVRTNNLADKPRIEAVLDDRERELAARGQTVTGPRPPVEVIYNSLTLHVDGHAGVEMKAPVRLLAAGRFDITKGFDVLLRALALLRGDGVAATLTLVGGGGVIMGLGNLEKTLRDLRRELCLEDVVDFPGLVSHDRFPGILKAHDIFVAPCVVAPEGQRDGIPNTVIEAMSFGLPVVASDVNGLPEVVRDGKTGRLVPPGDPRALADAIADLAADPERARAMGAAGAELAGTLFQPETNGRRLADLLARSCTGVGG